MAQNNPYIQKTDDGSTVTPAGKELLAGITTDAEAPVYAFTGDAPQLLVAAAMARLSRRGDDLRTIYLDEFASVPPEHAEALMDRVVTAYGDDSVQQLSTLSFVVEDASNLLTKKLEWGRLMSYLEQSTRYIYFDAKNANGEYKYFTPALTEDLRVHYRHEMDAIFDLYSEIVRGLTDYVRAQHREPTDKAERLAWLGATRAQACDAARPVLPVATKSTVGVVGSAQAVENLVRHLLADTLVEANDAGKAILKEARKVIGAFLKRADMPERGLAWALYMKDTREALRQQADRLSTTKDATRTPVTLVSYWPVDELELVPRMLYEQASGQSLDEIKAEVATWTEAQQEEVLKAYIGKRLNRRHKPGRAIEAAHYEWEIVGDYGTFRDLQRHRMVDAWEWQRLSPQHGYDIPDLVTEAGFAQQFTRCFEKSQALFDALVAAGAVEEAQYATLLGHKMRYHFLVNAREAYHLLELRTSPQGHPGYRKICQQMYEELCRVHPRLGAGMIFVNKSGDPALTRLEAERATQLKLQLLEEV